MANALFLCFNLDYMDYAKAAIISFRRYYPDWIIHCHAVNCKYRLSRDAWWNKDYIRIEQKNEVFPEKGLEREYCNSKRFSAYLPWLRNYDKIIATDVDIIFKERLTEIETALDKYDVCLYYNKDSKDIRNRAGASFLAFRSGRGAREFLSTYNKYLYSAGRNWWNDQICLAKACDELVGKVGIYPLKYDEYCYSGLDPEGLKKCHVIQPRGDKNSPVLQFYRNMVDEELGKSREKILIIGSGPSAEKAKKWNLAGWHVIAINNAWQVVDAWDELIFPDDFPKNKLPQIMRPDQKLISNEIYMPANVAFGKQIDRGNTMLFQALYYALLKKPIIIGVIGADLYYPSTGNTHFYGKGGLDPLRLGQDHLKEKFVRFMNLAKEHNVELVNFSGETRGLNPFSQKIFQTEKIERRWPKHFSVSRQLSLTGRKPRSVVK